MEKQIAWQKEWNSVRCDGSNWKSSQSQKYVDYKRPKIKRILIA